MAKNKNTAAPKRTKQQARQAEAQREEQRRKDAENAQKTARLSNAFLYTIMTVVGIFCLYVVIHTLLFRAKSISTLRSDLLFVSLVAIPYLILAVAFLIRKLRAKKRAEASKKVRLFGTLLYVAVMAGAVLLCTSQLFTGRVDASGVAAYTDTVAAAEGTGLSVRQPEEVFGFKALLEYSLEAELTVGETRLKLNYHTGGLAADLFKAQVWEDYSAFSATQTEGSLGAGVTIWDPVAGSEKPQAALCIRKGSKILIYELTGPEDELALLIPALTAVAP